MNAYLAHVNCSGSDQNASFARRFAEHYGLRVVDVRMDKRFHGDAVHAVAGAAFVLIWNGMQYMGPLAAALARAKSIPIAFYEYGMLPQGENYFVDLGGFCGDSMLSKALAWVTDEDRAALAAERENLRSQYPSADDGYTLVCLQIFNDSQVLFYTPYHNMQDVVDYFESVIPGPLVIRPHPKGKSDYKTSRALVTNKGSFWQWASKAKSVVSCTSTCLYEAMVYGKPVMAIGNHPVRVHHPARHDDLAAAALALNTPRGRDGDLAGILNRFGVRPLVCSAPSVVTKPHRVIEAQVEIPA